MEELSCQGLVELVTDYLEGALAPDEHARFDAHLAECSGCDLYVEQMRTTITLAHDTRELEQQPEVAALLAEFRHWRASG